MIHKKVLFVSITSVVMCCAMLAPTLSGSASASVPVDGSLDTTFGTNGKVFTDIGRAGLDEATSTAVQPDGKIIVVGQSQVGNSRDFVVVRYNTDGSLDATFDGDGKVTTDLGNPDCASTVAVQSNGKIIVAGTSSTDDSTDFALVRYNSNGTLDTTFGTNGKVITHSTGNDYPNSMTFDPDGKIIVVGWSVLNNAGDFLVARYNSNGTLDTTFGTNGKVTTDMANDNDYAMTASVQIDGKIIVVGESQTNSQYDFMVVRYNTDGSLDTTFDGETGNNGNGKITTDIGTNSGDNATAIAIQSNGKIIVAGDTYLSSSSDIALVRYNTDGSIDTTFGTNGKVTTDFNNSADYTASVALQTNRKIIICGTSGNDFAIVRYNEDGSLDSAFGTGGTLTTDFNNSADYTRSVALQANGKIIAVGSTDQATSTDFAIARYNEDGSLDTTFGANGKVMTNIAIRTSSDYATSVATQSDGKIVVAGIASNDFAITRYNIDGSLDSTFDGETGNNGNGKITTDIGGNRSDSADSVAIQTDGKIIAAGSTYTTSWDFAIVRYNTDGSRDTTFGVDGIVTTDMGTDSNDYGRSIAIQIDGKIIVAGDSTGQGTTDFALVRYNKDGSLDTSFDGETGNNGNGKITTNFGTDTNYYGRSVAIQTNGKIIVAGDTVVGNSPDFVLVRYNEDGSLDTTFDGETGNNGNGKITTNFGTDNNDYAYSVAIQIDGKIIAAGVSDVGYASDFAIARYNEDGSLDTTFDGETGANGNGKITTNISDWDYAYSVAVVSDGKIIAAGSTYENETNKFALVRYNSDGSLDTTFDGETGNNGNGKITTTVGTASSGCAANAIAVQSDGKIVAAGYNYNDFGTEDFVVFRYNATSRGLLSPTTTSSTTSSTTTTTTTTTTIATVASTTTTTAPTTPTITTIGTRSTTTIATPTTTATTIFSSPPSRATIAALPLASRPLVTETSLVPGLALTVTYGGFTPGEFVQLVVASTPQVIGSGYANEKGVVTVTGSLPIDLSADKHTLVVFAPLSKKGFRQPITVGPTILPTTGSTNQTHNLQIAMYLIIVGIGLLFARRRSATSFDQTL